MLKGNEITDIYILKIINRSLLKHKIKKCKNNSVS